MIPAQPPQLSLQSSSLFVIKYQMYQSQKWSTICQEFDVLPRKYEEQSQHERLFRICFRIPAETTNTWNSDARTPALLYLKVVTGAKGKLQVHGRKAKRYHDRTTKTLPPVQKLERRLERRLELPVRRIGLEEQSGLNSYQIVCVNGELQRQELRPELNRGTITDSNIIPAKDIPLIIQLVYTRRDLICRYFDRFQDM